MEALKRALSVGALIALLGGASVGFAAPDKAPDSYDAVIQAANAAYNAENYGQAARGFIEAIQSRPQHAVPYRNLARTYFWQQKYPEAVAYYDMYLRLATNADDREQVQSERKLASSRAGEEVWTTPEPQRQALAALEAKLEKGAAYTAGGGGAWGLYQALIRSGYAQPELGRLRRRLVTRILDEFEGTFVAEATQPMPRLELEAWELQQERLSAARQLTEDELLVSVIERRGAVAETGVALLNGQFDDAAKLAEEALEQNPDMPFVRWLQVTALVETGEHKQALEAVDALAKKLAQTRPGQIGYAKVLRAVVLQRMGRGGDAADLYLGLIGE